MFLSSGDASDSICPKGWGMAGAYNEDKAFQKLIFNTYGAKKDNEITILNYEEYFLPINFDQISLQFPNSFFHTGFILFNGNYSNKGENGRFWTKRINSITNSKYLILLNTGIGPRSNSDRGQGLSVRCVAKAFLIFSSQLSSGDASDSICPKGWGMAEWDGEGSYEKLIMHAYGANRDATNRTLSINYKEYDKNVRPDEILLQNYLYIRSGLFEYRTGNRSLLTSAGFFYTGAKAASVIFMSLFSTGLFWANTESAGQGLSLRRVAKSPLFS